MSNIPLFLHDDIEKYFYNRKEDLNKINYLLNSLNQSIPQQLLLVGYRGVGKSYLLKKIRKELPKNILSIYLDISQIYSMENAEITTVTILLEMLNKINEEYTNQMEGSRKVYTHIINHLKKLEIKDYDFSQSSKIAEIPIPHTENNFRKLSKFVMQLPQNIVDNDENLSGFVIFMDEFQLLRKLKNPDAFFWLIRSFNQTQHNVSYVFTGSISKTSEFIEKLNGEKGAFGERIIQISINPFSKEETKKYFNDKLDDVKFTEDGFDRFYECTKGIPLYINSFYNVLKTDEIYDANKIKETFILNMEQILWKMSRIWSSLSRYEKEIVIIFTEENDLTWTQLYNKVNFARGTFDKYLENLKNSGLIEYNNKKYYLSDKMIKTWLKHEKEVNGYYPI